MGIIDVSSGVTYLQEHGIPVYRFPESAAKAYGALYQYAQWMNRQHLAQFELKHEKEKADEIIHNHLAAGKTHLGDVDGRDLIKCYGFNILETQLAKTGEEAADIAENMGFPVVMKIVSPQILHKSDAGGVVIGLESKEAVLKTFDKIVERASAHKPDAVIEGVAVQQMARHGEEVILGMNRYPVFGPLLMFGVGGIFVEVFQDVVFRLAPIGRNEARRMIRSIRGYNLFTGFRGRPKADVENLQKRLVSLSVMAINHPEIKEMDINPLMVHEEGKGATAADCRIILEVQDRTYAI
jgi:acetyltransferase